MRYISAELLVNINQKQKVFAIIWGGFRFPKFRSHMKSGPPDFRECKRSRAGLNSLAGRRIPTTSVIVEKKKLLSY